MKNILNVILLVSTFYSLGASAQARVFTATGVSEIGDQIESEVAMQTSARKTCRAPNEIQQVSETKFRPVYTYLHATAEFACIYNDAD